MPLTKVRYDMLDIEITQKISEAGSPLIFAEDPNNANKEVLSQYRTDGVIRNIRTTAFSVDGKLVLTLASFTPTVTVTGQSRQWDQTATTFTVNADNPTADYPDEWLTDVVENTETTGTVTEDLTKYTKVVNSGGPLPLTASGDFNVTFTTKNGEGFIYSNGSGATGGSASAIIKLNSKLTGNTPASLYTPDTPYILTTSWANVTRNITLTPLSNLNFLQKYTSTSYNVSVGGLSDVTRASHTITGTNSGTNDSGISTKTGTGNISGTLTFATPIYRRTANKPSTKLTLTTTATRPAGITGLTGYTHSFTALDSADVEATASYTFPSFTTRTASNVGTSGGPSIDASTFVTASGFNTSNVTVLNHEQKTFSQAVTNSTSEPIRFWFFVKTAAGLPTKIETGGVNNDGTQSFISAASYETAVVSLAPTSPPADFQSESYTGFGVNIGANTTLWVSMTL